MKIVVMKFGGTSVDNIEKIRNVGKTISKHYKKDIPITDKFLFNLFKKWSPYSSTATWYLWRSLDPLPVSY